MFPRVRSCSGYFLYELGAFGPSLEPVVGIDIDEVGGYWVKLWKDHSTLLKRFDGFHGKYIASLEIDSVNAD